MRNPEPTNRLVHETSPYLLQHARNPVDWYPWGEEALTRARKENKPILLSIGYSSCHWCHVMERESFENEDVARMMNERFVNIKVDREERPDLDELYMHAVQAITGSGGWPLTVFLTPDLVPFHGGTYFPPEDRGGMPGFKRILMTVSDYYREHREEVTKITAQMKDALHQIVQIVPSRESPDERLLHEAFEVLKSQFDRTHGGFGGAPKFPNSMALSFLLRYWKRTREEEALSMVERTLEKMANGGICDQLGGGFHRYSVDEKWLIPHFEKMLYDNALLSRTYLEAYQATGKEGYLRIAEEILHYILREMRSPEGAFYSAQDADSEGEEGKFFVWSKDEIEGTLGKKKGNLFCAYYGVTAEGNFEKGANVLHPVSSLGEFSEARGIPVSELEKVLEEGREKLFAKREKRVKPGRDEKVLTSWNGLTISSFVDGFKVTGNGAYLRAAEDAAHFILRKMGKDGHLLRAHKDGKSHIKGYSEDYAFLTQALLDLHEATFEASWLTEADRLNREMIRQFWDDKGGGFYFTGKEHEFIVAQSKNPYDNVTPSPNSVATFNLIRLSYLTGDESLEKRAEEIFRLFHNFLQEHPTGFTQMLSGLSFFLNAEQIGVIGSKKDPGTQSMLREIYSLYLPDKILSLKDPQDPVKDQGPPFLADKMGYEGPVVFVCKKHTCLPPVKNEEELKKILEG